MTLSIGVLGNDDGEACKIDKRGVPYKVGSDGRRLVPSRRPKHLYSPREWDKLDAKSKKKSYKKAKREKAKDARLARKRAAVGNALDKMIFPKIVQCDKIDFELGSSCTEGWEWAQELVSQQLQEVFLDDVIPAVPASLVFDDNWFLLCHVRRLSNIVIASRMEHMDNVTTPWSRVQ